MEDPWQDAVAECLAALCSPCSSEAAEEAAARSTPPRSTPSPARVPSTPSEVAHDRQQPMRRRRQREGGLLQEALQDLGVEARPFDRAQQLAEARKRIRRQPAQNAISREPAEPQSDEASLVIACKSAGLPAIPECIVQSLATGSNAVVPLSRPWPLQSFVRSAYLRFRSEDDAPDPGDQWHRLNQWLVGGTSSRITTKASAVDMLQIDRRKLLPHVQRVANWAVHLDRDFRCAFEAMLTNMLPESSLIAYIDGARYDETPLRMAVSSIARASRVDPSQKDAVVTAHESMLPSLQVGCQKTATVCKILQPEQTFGVLVRGPQGQLLRFVGTTLCWLQLVERTTGECLLEAQRLREAVTGQADLFKSKTRLTTLDGAPSNDRAERALLSSRKHGWQRLALPCEVHRTATAHKRTFDLTADTIKG